MECLACTLRAWTIQFKYVPNGSGKFQVKLVTVLKGTVTAKNMIYFFRNSRPIMPTAQNLVIHII
jgi:hypothetical protein